MSTTSSPATSPLSFLANWQEWRVRRWLATTPGRLWGTLACIWALALLFYVAAIGGAGVHRKAMKTVGKDAAPSILAAQKIKASLADMHANAANELLHEPGKGQQAAKDYEKRRIEVTEALLEAAGNITYDAEREPLRRLLDNLGPYESAVAQARVLHERKLSGALERHRVADKIMNASLLPAAEDLDKVNRDALNEGYATARGRSIAMLLGVLVSGAVLLAALIATQVFLYRRMRRLLNPGLLAASALAASFLAYVVVAFLAQERALKLAKEDAFHSLHDLWRARALAYDANGDESRWLLDRAGAPRYEKAFNDKVAKVMQPPASKSGDDMVRAARKGKLPKEYKGYLASELQNITFAGEEESALATLEAFVVYVKIDAEVRRLQNAGKHAEALALCVGTQPGQSNWAYDRFDEALGKTIAINHKEFNQAVDHSLGALAPFDYAAPLAALGVAALAFFGVLPRLREYAIN